MIEDSVTTDPRGMNTAVDDVMKVVTDLKIEAEKILAHLVNQGRIETKIATLELNIERLARSVMAATQRVELR